MLTPDGQVDYYVITTLCPSERTPSTRCNAAITTPNTQNNVVQSVDGLNAFKNYTFRVIAAKNSTTSASYVCNAITGSKYFNVIYSVTNESNC